MRGSDEFTEQLFTVKRLEDFVPTDHPLRPVRLMVNQALARMDGLFSSMYAPSRLGSRIERDLNSNGGNPCDCSK
jgi:hypothetical protein